MFAELVCIALAVCLLFCESVKGRLADVMSIETLLERKINAGSKVVWKVNIFKGLELKYETHKRFCFSIRSVLPVVQTSECAKKCANDVPLVYGWSSADLRLA
jgi:hypothetical protein